MFVCTGSFRTSGTKSPTTPPMVSNPIYEGQPLYETIDPQFRLPMPLPPVNTSLGSACPSPLESPYKNAVSPYSNCPQLLTFTTTLEEGYTIMSSARDESKNSESHSSGSEPESADMARYVPDPSLQYASECWTWQLFALHTFMHMQTHTHTHTHSLITYWTKISNFPRLHWTCSAPPTHLPTLDLPSPSYSPSYIRERTIECATITLQSSIYVCIFVCLCEWKCLCV